MLRVLAILLAVALCVLPAGRWELDAVAGQTWAVAVGESPRRRAPVVEAVRVVSAGPYEHYAVRAASRRLVSAVVVLLVAVVFS